MMQRKNKSKHTSTTGYGYENNNDNNNNDRLLKSSPSKPPSSPTHIKPNVGGISIASLTGHTGIISNNNSTTTTSCNNANCSSTECSSSSHNIHNKGKQKAIAMATVKRNTFGTRPFDKYWLNLDCCGLICATLTYCLHLYGIYSFGWILLPPWFSVMDDDGYRELTFGCHFHRTLFILIATLAITAHFKAMTTDPGAVPPDASPLPEINNMDITKSEEAKLNDLDNLIKGEPSPTKLNVGVVGGGSMNNNLNSMEIMERGGSSNTNNSSSLMQEDDSLLQHDNTTNNNGLSQAGAVVTTAAGAVVGVAGVAAAAGVAMAGQVASAAGPIKAKKESGTSTMPHTQQRGRRMCRRCHAYKPPRAHHCSICKRCIIKMDHHCPWVNNCVGIGNHKYFLLFIFYTSLSCAYSFICIVYRFVHCVSSSNHHGPRCVDHPTDLLPLVGLTVESLLFGLFTLCMMVDQWDVVMTNLTHIDRLKGEAGMQHNHNGYGNHHQHAGAYGKLPQHYHQHVGSSTVSSTLMNNVRAGINEVFGTGHHSMTTTSSRFHYTWLSPLHKVCFPETVRNDIFGYCRPTKATGVVAEGARRISKSMEMVGRGSENMMKGRGGVGGAAEIV